MVQRLKRWESPRRQGRNKKGRGGSARLRQLKKQQQMLRNKLKGQQENKKQNKQNKREEKLISSFSVLIHMYFMSCFFLSPLSPRSPVSPSAKTSKLTLKA